MARTPAALGDAALQFLTEYHLGTLTTLRKDQADYINVPVEGPYKPEHYRY